jgi:Flp pilus assembly protein TadB
MDAVRPKLRIHWAWLPAAIAWVVVIGIRYGLLAAVLVTAGGLGFGLYIERRARRRRERSDLE